MNQGIFHAKEYYTGVKIKITRIIRTTISPPNIMFNGKGKFQEDLYTLIPFIHIFKTLHCV